MVKHKVKKNVIQGPHFVEHRYSKFNENLIGLFTKVGLKVESNPSIEAAGLFCDKCKHRDGTINIEDETGVSRSYGRSYQVEGVTKPFNKYDWEIGYVLLLIF